MPIILWDAAREEMKKKTFDEVQERKRNGTEAAGELCVVLRWRVKKNTGIFIWAAGSLKVEEPHTHESLKPGINNNNNNLL